MKKILVVLGLLAVISLACGFFGGDKEVPTKEPEIKQESGEDAGGMTTDRSSKTESAPTPVLETEEEEKDADEPETNAADSGAPQFFVDEFDGPLNTTDWILDEYFALPEGVEEDDDEAKPIYTIEQERGALKFNLDSPYLYLYHTYTPHKYQDVRIDFEVENKGANTNNIGLFCRSTDYGWYEFIATSGGYYSIMRYYEDEDKELATGGIKSIKFGKDKKNVFTAICKGKTLTFIVNDVVITKVKDEEIPDAGYAGINISSEAYVPVNVELNWLSISEP
ncbi:MAG: hypothetical protein IT308_04240 [Anaerolineaceae bacterium]|nr:hypothetical protein [Anaerolineaceae bacterium]